MTTAITEQRQSEIMDELQLASRYFQRLSAELKLDETVPLPGDESQMALHIYQSVLLLQWRLESFSSNAKYTVMRSSMADHAMPIRDLAQHTFKALPERALNGHSVNGHSININGHSVNGRASTEQASGPVPLDSIHNQSD